MNNKWEIVSDALKPFETKIKLNGKDFPYVESIEYEASSSTVPKLVLHMNPSFTNITHGVDGSVIAIDDKRFLVLEMTDNALEDIDDIEDTYEDTPISLDEPLAYEAAELPILNHNIQLTSTPTSEPRLTGNWTGFTTSDTPSYNDSTRTFTTYSSEPIYTFGSSSPVARATERGLLHMPGVSGHGRIECTIDDNGFLVATNLKSEDEEIKELHDKIVSMNTTNGWDRKPTATGSTVTTSATDSIVSNNDTLEGYVSYADAFKLLEEDRK